LIDDLIFILFLNYDMSIQTQHNESMKMLKLKLRRKEIMKMSFNIPTTITKMLLMERKLINKRELLFFCV